MNYFTREVKEADYDFLWNLHEESMRVHIEKAFGSWDDELARNQFKTTYEPDEMKIIQLEGSDVGMYKLQERVAERFLARIQILPEHQSNGIGTAVIRDLLARDDPRPVTLRVLKNNRARLLYERLGFRTTGESEYHFQMAAVVRR